MSNNTSTTQSTATEPQPEPDPERTPERTPEQVAQDLLEKQSKLNLGLLGSAVQSIRRGLAWEHNMVEQEGGELGPKPTGEDDMGNLVLGDVRINDPQQPKEDRTDAVLELAKLAATRAAPVAATGISPWWLLIPTALSLLGGGAALYTATQKPDPPPVVSPKEGPDADTKYDLEFAEPTPR